MSDTFSDDGVSIFKAFGNYVTLTEHVYAADSTYFAVTVLDYTCGQLMETRPSIKAIDARA